MDENVLNSNLIRRCNPGLTDFGSGNVIALSSQCLRNAKAPTDCRECIECCPAQALEADANMRPRTTTDCLKCGLCINVCPTDALAATTKTIQQIVRLLLQATLRVDELALTCQRSLALLRLEAMSLSPDQAAADLDLLKKAQTSENLFVVSCLAMLSEELWFTVLNEIGVSRLSRVFVYLPGEQCALCPANIDGQADRLLAESIDSAERWSRQTVVLVDQPSEVPQYHKASVTGYLSSLEDADRREMITGFVDELKRSMDDAGRTGNRAQDETLRIRARKETTQRTLLADDLYTSRTPAQRDKPILSTLRQALVESIGRNPEHADTVSLPISETDLSLCDGCGQCVASCPLHARYLESTGGETRDEPGAAGAAGAGAGAAGAAGAGAGAADAGEPQSRQAHTDALYCLGCSACIQACPKKACHFQLISGLTFLRDNQ